MSTRSLIGIENPDGTIEAIYCHFDGYPENHGPILAGHYTTEEQVRKLIALGDLSSLDISPERPEGHSCARPVSGFCVAYGRDCGETETGSCTYANREAYLKADRWQEYEYLFSGGKWLVHLDDWKPLAPEFPSGDDRVGTMSEAEIMALFEWLDFKEQHGHPLTMCIDFQVLVKRAVGNVSYGVTPDTTE